MDAAATTPADSPEVGDAPGRNRYEIRLDGQLAGFAAYRLNGSDVVFTHTEIDPDFEGRGVGSALARAALDDVRRTGRRAVPQCPFIAAYIERHPAYQDLVGTDT